MYQGRSHVPAPTDGASVKETCNITAAKASGQVFSFQNTEGKTVVVERVWLHVRTRNDAGAATLDIGTAANGTTSSDNLLDGVSIAGSNTIYDNITDIGTNGKSRQLLTAGQYITATVVSGDANGLKADLYARFMTCEGGSIP